MSDLEGWRLYRRTTNKKCRNGVYRSTVTTYCAGQVTREHQVLGWQQVSARTFTVTRITEIFSPRSHIIVIIKDSEDSLHHPAATRRELRLIRMAKKGWQFIIV